MTVTEALTGGRGDTVTVNGVARHVVGYMKDFLFSPEQARTPLGKLSGGERGRLMLAQALARPSNLLVLDEPTNDLDMETLDVLEDVLGTITPYSKVGVIVLRPNGEQPPRYPTGESYSKRTIDDDSMCSGRVTGKWDLTEIGAIPEFVVPMFSPNV